MSPVSTMARLAIRAAGATTQIDAASPSTTLIDRDTVSSVPSASAAAEASTPTNHGMNTTTKIGLAMIPVVVVLVGLYIVFLFWYRRRRAARKSIRGSISPPLPEEDLYSYNSSIDSRQRSSKVCQMAAFSAPVHNGRPGEARFLHEGAAQPKHAPIDKGKGIQVEPPAIPIRNAARMVDADGDSPIDGSSPFRLKRGDTIKRSSLGPELARLWPSPPASVWIKPLATDGLLPTPVSRRESPVYQERPARHQF